MKIKSILPVCLVFSIALTACGPGQIFGPTITPTATITLTLTPTNTLTPTLTLTPTPVPPTATPTPIPIILTDGTHEWIVKSVALDDTSAYTPPLGYSLIEGYRYLTIEFDNVDDGDLVSIVMGIDTGGGITKVSVISGLSNAYVTDSQNNKYYALEVAQTYIIIPVKEGSSGFTLYVADLAPVELGK